MSTSARWPLLVTPAWLHARLPDPSIVVLDCSWHMPQVKRCGRTEFAEAAIPSARFFDVDGTSDRASPLPHMLAAAEEFEQHVAELGIDASQHLVCYDSTGIFSAPRAWWTFRVHGHEAVSVLDGGLPAWRAAGFQTAPGAAPPAPRSGQPPWKSRGIDSSLVRSIEDVRALVANECSSAQVVDARASPRFQGTAPEPRPECVSGHMPGSNNLPFSELLEPVPGADAGTQLATTEKLKAAFERAGVRSAEPFVASCGSGMTACVIALAAAQLGNQRVAVYDGSWSEWGARKDTPIVKQGD